MKAVYFIEKDGVKYYKCDTFWSKSTDITNAKIHDDSRVNDFLRSLIGSEPKREYQTASESMINGSIYGYQTFDESQLDGPYKLKKDPKILHTHYVKKLFLNSNGVWEFMDYKEIVRNEKIGKILKPDS